MSIGHRSTEYIYVGHTLHFSTHTVNFVTSWYCLQFSTTKHLLFILKFGFLLNMATEENSHDSSFHTYNKNECNSQMSSVAKGAQRSYDNVTYDELLSQLLHIEDLFKKSQIYSVSYSRALSKLLDKLSAMGRAEPYQPPSRNLVNSVEHFVKVVEDNEQIIAQVLSSTQIALNEIESVADLN